MPHIRALYLLPSLSFDLRRVVVLINFFKHSQAWFFSSLVGKIFLDFLLGDCITNNCPNRNLSEIKTYQKLAGFALQESSLYKNA